MHRVPVLVLCLLVMQCGAAFGQARDELSGRTQQIPRNGYTTWSLFLICTPDWVTRDMTSDLANLYQRFQAFGDAIGDDNLAVWFWKRDTPLDDPRLSENVDVPRSAEYCRALRLPPSEGPFVVVTTAYPDLKTFPRDRAVFALGGLSPRTWLGC